MGAWIETLRESLPSAAARKSHPTWVRGLKHDEYGIKDISD